MRVDGRDDVGIVFDEGKVGVVTNIYCVGIYLPETGEVAYYANGGPRSPGLRSVEVAHHGMAAESNENDCETIRP